MTELAATGRNRINSIDILRGIVMVIMALDHTRDFFHLQVVQDGSSVATGPTDLATTNPVLFFTRWITHFCAPIFVFLAGTSAFMMSFKKTKGQLSAFLLKRGVWLVLVELLIISFGWTFNPLFNVLILQVIWTIGISMIILGLLIWLPFWSLLIVGLIIVFGHNLLDYPSINNQVPRNLFTELAYFSQFNVYFLDRDHLVLVVYSFLPWTGLMILGYCFGKFYSRDFDPVRRRKILWQMGLALIILFIGLRFINNYGDPVPWSEQPRGPVYTFLSFFNVNKYPPSLDFLAMTIGVGLIMLSVLESAKNKLTEFFRVFGRVPMLYYILHFYLLHILVVIFFFIQGYPTSRIVTENNPFLFRPPEFGFPLWGVYLVWIFVFMALYPICKKYDRYKTANVGRKWWLGYL